MSNGWRKALEAMIVGSAVVAIVFAILTIAIFLFGLTLFLFYGMD